LLPLSSPLNGQAHLDTALSYVGVREKTLRNDGPEVEKFLSYVGLRKGNSWCAAFVSYCLGVNNVVEPSIRSGLAYNFTKGKYVIKASDVLKYNLSLPKGTIVIWQKGTTIFGHIGFAVKPWSGIRGVTVEGNTSSGEKGSQSNGDGVYIRNRSINRLNYFSIRYFTLVLPDGKETLFIKALKSRRIFK
jgi:hypothetical protein